MDVSVIVCTRNPRMEYFMRALVGLKEQTLSYDKWELLVIDNGSVPPLVDRLELGWHPKATIYREDQLGVTLARVRGMKEADGELLIYVDDDNILARDFLERAVNLFAIRPDLGAVSGRLDAEYEEEPPEWFRGEYTSWLAIRPIEKSYWSNFLDRRTEPCGAGLCFRRTVGRAYLEKVKCDGRPLLLSRQGASLLSGGDDVFLAKTAIAEGYSIGLFADLRITHLIPAKRVKPRYLFSIYRHIVASGLILGVLESKGQSIRRISSREVMVDVFKTIFRGSIERRLVWERLQARRLAKKLAVKISQEGLG